MKSKNLLTTPDLIASNYTITPIQNGKYLHQFTPANTDTVYQFVANNVPVITEGERYNVGYYVDEKDRNIIELSALSKKSETNPIFSLNFARKIADEIFTEEKSKNDSRIKSDQEDGYYWLKKQAWRIFALCISKEAFFQYLDEINHPKISCTVTTPDNPPSNGYAYKEDGIEDAIYHLISSAEKINSRSNYYKSPHYSKRFEIHGVKAITDKK